MSYLTSKLKKSIVIALLTLSAMALCEPYFDKLIALAKERYGLRGADVVSDWKTMMQTAQPLSEQERLLHVNDFFNQQVQFKDDIVIWGKNDYWATPLETMGLQQGDCEDFSIAKYISLLKLSIPLEKLRLIYVKAKIPGGQNQAHMVLAYYSSLNAEPIILDNLYPDILPASKRRDLVPVFSFNSAGLWVGNSRQPKIKKPETRLSRWQDVITRMQFEGLQ